MPTLTSGSSPRIAFLVLAAVFTLGAVVAACASPDTSTPACTNNVSANGLVAMDGGCEQFPMCTLGSNGDATPCCKDADGGTLTGNDLATCRYGYGDPGCLYLVIVYTNMGVDMAYTCSSTPPSGSSSSGAGGGSTASSTSTSGSGSSSSSTSGSSSTSASSSSSGSGAGGGDAG